MALNFNLQGIKDEFNKFMNEQEAKQPKTLKEYAIALAKSNSMEDARKILNSCIASGLFHNSMDSATSLNVEDRIYLHYIVYINTKLSECDALNNHMKDIISKAIKEGM